MAALEQSSTVQPNTIARRRSKLIRELQNSHIDLRISLPTKIIDNHAIPPIDLHIYTWMNHLLSVSYLVLARVAKVEICEISF